MGDVSRVSPDTYLEFKAFKLVKSAAGIDQELVGTFRLAIAQMRLQDYTEKVRKSLGLLAPQKTGEAGRFNLALVVLDDERMIEAESRSLVEKLKAHDISTSMI